METSINACPLIDKMGELFLIKFDKRTNNGKAKYNMKEG